MNTFFEVTYFTLVAWISFRSSYLKIKNLQYKGFVCTWLGSYTYDIHTNTFMCTWRVQGKKMKIYVSWKSSCTLFCIYCFFFPKLLLLDMSCMLISSKSNIKRHFQEYLNVYARLNRSWRQINELRSTIFKLLQNSKWEQLLVFLLSYNKKVTS